MSRCRNRLVARSERRAAAVIAPGHTYATVTDKISAIVAHAAHADRLAGASGSPSAFAADAAPDVAVTLAVRHGRRHLGHQHPRRLGLRHRQLRLVDRDRPRRHAHLGDPAAAAPGVAHLDQPLRRGDDAVRGDVRRACSRCCTWAGPGSFYWLLPYPEHDGPLAAVPQPAGVGRVRGLDLLHRLAAVLVHRPGPRPGHAARPAQTPVQAGDLRHVRLGWRGSARHWHALRDGLPAAGRPGDAAGRLGAHAWSASTSPSRSCPAGTRRSSRPTSSPAPSTPASPWC